MYAGIEDTVSAEDRASIEALLSEFYWRLDHKGAGSVAELFAEGGTLVTPRGTVTGRDHISQWFINRTTEGERITRHGWSNLRLSAAGTGRVAVEAHVRTIATASSSRGQPIEVMFGDTIDVVVNNPRSGWLFESRRLEVVVQGRTSIGAGGT
ncbi:MAG: nuclear transport factor 2 family protein [Steroidobacteraceae bacterium]|jgi:hypothetical protein